MTLGRGGYGGNITSDNISPAHPLNIKHMANTEVTPAIVRTPAPQASAPALPRARSPRKQESGWRQTICQENRPIPGLAGLQSPAGRGGVARPPGNLFPPSYRKQTRAGPQAPVVDKPADFVCEDDVRQAVKQNRKIVIGEKTIVTPAARDLAEQHRVFVQAGWRA